MLKAAPEMGVKIVVLALEPNSRNEFHVTNNLQCQKSVDAGFCSGQKISNRNAVLSGVTNLICRFTKHDMQNLGRGEGRLL